MRETSSAMNFLLELLNLNFQSSARRELRKIEHVRGYGTHYKVGEIEATQMELRGKLAPFMGDSDRYLQISSPTNRLLQSRLNALAIDQNQGASTPEYSKLLELVEDLNGWAESTGPDGRGLHPRWQVNSADKARRYMQPGQALLRLGRNKYVVKDWFIIHAFRDQALACVARCLQTGELGRLRKCRWCSKYFFAGHFRKRFCTPGHQKRYDAKAAPLRVQKARRKAGERKRQQAQDAKEAAGIKSLENFLKKAGGDTNAQMSVGELLKRIPGKWKTVTPWLARYKTDRDVKEIWRKLPEAQKKLFLSNGEFGPAS